MMTSKTRRNVFALVLAAFVAAACGSSDVSAAPADSQQYSTSSANAEVANSIANALSSANRLVRDGKGITADSDGAGSSPINPGLKVLWDMVRGLRCAVWGNCVGVDMRTLKALHIDGTGGVATTSAAAGSILASGPLVSAKTSGGGGIPRAANPQGEFVKDSAVFGYVTMEWSGASHSSVGAFNVDTFTRNSAGNYDVRFSNQPVNALSCVISATGYKNSVAGLIVSINNQFVSSSKLVARVEVWEPVAGVHADGGITLIAFCPGL